MSDEINLKDPAVQAAIKAAVGAAKEEMQAEMDKAEAKQQGLLDDLKKAQRELRAAKEIKPEDVEALESDLDKARTELAEANKQVKTLTAERDKATKALEDETGATRKLIVENGLREQLAANGVTNAVHQKAAMAILASGVEVAVDGDNRVAKVGDKALADFVKEWAGGEEGQHFVSVSVNGGGGAPGGGGKPGAKNPFAKDSFNFTEQGLIAKTDPARAKALAAEAGVDLNI